MKHLSPLLRRAFWKNWTFTTLPSVVIHDALIGGLNVSDLPLEGLKQFDVEKEEKSPTLQEAIACVKGGCEPYIELKGEGTEPLVIDLVRRNSMQDGVVIR